MNEWISVKDRLPEKSGDYLVYALYFITGKNEIAVYQDYYDAKAGVWEQEFFLTDESKVTHWMPIPQPPKDIKEESK